MVLREMTDEELSKVYGQGGLVVFGEALNELGIKFPEGVAYDTLHELVTAHLNKLNKLDPSAMAGALESMVGVIIAGGLLQSEDIEVGPIIEDIINHNLDLLVNYLKDTGMGHLQLHNYRVEASGKIKIEIRT